MILDIGANEGEFALALAQLNPNLQVLAFEPIPVLAAAIKERASTLGCRNLSCHQIAIDEAARLATFHIADHYDRGVSSLLQFDRAAIDANDYWQQRPDLHFSYDLKVQVCRLDEVLADDPPARIRFIKIDAQGVDLAVLRSLGSLLGRVEAGMVEAPATMLTRLYSEEDVDLLAVLNFLREHGFDVHALKPNDPAVNEFNVIFHRRGLDWRALERDLHLRGLPLYDGKHFWHLPANHLLHPEAELAESRAAAEELAVLRPEAERLRQAEAAAQSEVRRHVDILRTTAEELAALRPEAERLRQAEAAAQSEVRRHVDILKGATDEIARLHPQATALQAEVAVLRPEVEALRPEVERLRRVEAEAARTSAAAQREAAKAMEVCSTAYQSAMLAQQEIGRMRVAREHLLAANLTIRTELEETRRLLGVKRAELTQASHATERAHAEAQALHDRILGLYRSTSWRLTGPLRRLVRLVRG